MKPFHFGLLLAAAQILNCHSETLRLEGELFHPDAPVVWDKSVTNIPESIVVYQLFPQQFSNETISNLLAMASFTPKTMKLSPDKKTMSWRHYENEGKRLVRSLDIAPVYGSIDYHNYGLTVFSNGLPSGVPASDEVERLALQYFERLGGDTNQLSIRHHSGTAAKRSRFDKKSGKYVGESVTMRGVMYARQLDGIRFLGAGGRGGFAMDFGRDTNVASLQFDWRNVRPYRRCKTLGHDEIVSLIVAGNAVLSAENGEVPSNPKKLTIVKATPYYMSEISGKPDDFIIPFVNLEMLANTEGSNSIVIGVNCAIISSNEFFLRQDDLK